MPIAAVAILGLLVVVSSLFLVRIWNDSREERIGHYEKGVLAEKLSVQRFRMLTGSGSPRLLEGTGSFFFPARSASTSEDHPIERSVRALERIAGELPDRFEAHYYRAVALATLGRRGEAHEALQDVFRRNAGFLPALLLDQELDAGPDGELDGEPDGELDGAPTTSLRTEEPSSAADAVGWQSPYRRARRATREKRWLEAARSYRQLLALERDTGALYLGSSLDFSLGRGLALLEAGELREASEAFIEARARWPSLLEPPLLLAKAYVLRGDREGARSTLQKLWDRSPADSRDRVAAWCAALHFLLRDVEAGVRWANLMRDEVGRLRLLSHLPITLVGGDDAWRVAIAAARKLAELDPQDTAGLSWLTMKKIWGHWSRTGPERRREIEEGVRLCRKVLQKQPENGFVKTMLGLAQRALGRRDGARERLGGVSLVFVKGVLEERADDPTLLRTLAFLRVNVPLLRDLPRARDLVSRRIASRGRDDAETLAILAEIELADGDAESALRALEEALKRPGASLHHAALLAACRERVPGGSPSESAREPTEAIDPADLRHVAEEIEHGGAIRINCGGGEKAGTAGPAWEADRFFRGGRRPLESGFEAPSRVEVRRDDGSGDTVADEVYQTYRVFHAEEYRAGYRVSLPKGSYRVVLRLCAARARVAGLDVFDVSVEGKPWLERYDGIAEAGFAVATSRTIEDVRVEDGALDLEFRVRSGVAAVSAIEVWTMP